MTPNKPDTCIIETENGPVVINQSDFNEETMTLASDDAPAKKAAKKTAKAKKEDAPVEHPKMLVDNSSGKSIVVGEDGKPIELEGIDAAGYADDAAAWAAITALIAA